MASEVVINRIPPEVKPNTSGNIFGQNPPFLIRRDRFMVIPLGTISNSEVIIPNSEIVEVNKATKRVFNGLKDRRGYIDETGRRIIRRSGRGGCQCQGNEKSSSCKSRRCKNEGRNLNPQNTNVAQVTTRAEVANRTNRANRRRVVFGAQRIRNSSRP